MPTGLAGMTIALVLACWAHAKRETRPALPWTAVLCVLVYGSVRVTRVAALAAPLAILIVGPALANWSILKTWRPQAPSRAAAALTILPLFVVAIFVFRAVAPLVSCIPLEGAWIPDTRSGQVLTHSAMPGRLVTLFGWGQYAIWHFGPQLRVSWDGRRETVYSDEVGAIHASIYRGGPVGDAWLSGVRPEYVWLSSKESARREWLRANGYRIDVTTDAAYVAVRQDLPMLPPPAATGEACFP